MMLCLVLLHLLACFLVAVIVGCCRRCIFSHLIGETFLENFVVVFLAIENENETFSLFSLTGFLVK